MEHRPYRHELKYLVSPAQIAMLRQRLGGLTRPDPHAGETGSYSVRSLYFDDYENSCFYDNENGADHRAKYRLRIYDGSDGHISLECKRKDGGMTQKSACLLTRSQADRLIAGNMVSNGEDPPLLGAFRAAARTRLLRPAVIVEYERTPYVCDNGNVRITFDTAISSSRAFGLFFSKSLPRRPIMSSGMQLLEIKYDAFLPDAIYRALQIDARQTAFSKYYYARKYTLL